MVHKKLCYVSKEIWSRNSNETTINNDYNVNINETDNNNITYNSDVIGNSINIGKNDTVNIISEQGNNHNNTDDNDIQIAKSK